MNNAGSRDFDFLFGSSAVRHRRLAERLAGSTEWVDFHGTQRAWPLLGGLANVDDNEYETPDGTSRGVSLRSFDPHTETWAIWWLGDTARHALDVPVVGRFVDGVGTFLADDTFHGEPIVVRFTWSDITRTSSEWEQAFSSDGGTTWEPNWTMSFTKSAARVNLGRTDQTDLVVDP
jgi:hypothetical protein